MIAIVCGDAQGNASLVTTPENLPNLPRDEEDSVELYCIRAEDWAACMAAYYDIEGLGHYDCCGVCSEPQCCPCKDPAP